LTKFISRRLFHLVFILIGVSILVFLMLRLIPGDPAHLLVGEFASPADVARIREKLGLDRSYPYQYYIYVKNLLKGDMGVSVRSNVPVSQEVFVRFLATVNFPL
jgi:peptide/nickel transport system permease protein